MFRAFPFGYVGVRLFVILTASLDGAGKPDSEGVAVAGLVSTETRLRRFSKQWGRLLTKYRLPFFHAAQCMARKGPYRKWRDKWDERLLSFVRVANLAILYPVGVSIPTETYNKLPRWDRERSGNQYFFAAWGCFHEATRWLRTSRPDRDKVAYVYDWGDEGRGEVSKVGNFIHDDIDLRAMHRIVSMEFQSKEMFTPIQAADLIAWAVRDEVLRRLGVSRPPRPTPLLSLRMPLLLYPTPDQLRDIAARFASANIRQGRGWKANPLNARRR